MSLVMDTLYKIQRFSKIILAKCVFCCETFLVCFCPKNPISFRDKKSRWTGTFSCSLNQRHLSLSKQDPSDLPSWDSPVGICPWDGRRDVHRKTNILSPQIRKHFSEFFQNPDRKASSNLPLAAPFRTSQLDPDPDRDPASDPVPPQQCLYLLSMSLFFICFCRSLFLAHRSFAGPARNFICQRMT